MADAPTAWGRRFAVSVFIAVFVTWSANPAGLAKLPLRAILKDDLGLPPEGMAVFFALAGLGWVLKPLLGLLSDHVPIRGTRRRHYVLLSGVGAALAWVAAMAAPIDATALLAAMVVTGGFAALGNAAIGGLLVDAGRAHGVTRHLSAVRVAAMYASTLLAGLLGGWLAGRRFAWTCVVCAAAMSIMVVVLRDLPQDASDRPPSGSPRSALRGALVQLRRREVLAVAGLTAAFYAVPGFQSMFYYHQRDVLHLSDAVIGQLSALNCAGGVLATICYGRVGRSRSLGGLVVAGILLNGASALLYFGYVGLGSALLLEPLLGFCLVLGVLPLYELTARACPPQHEAMVFAMILGVGNAAIAASDVLGTQVAQTLAVGVEPMIVVNALGTMATAALLVTVPRALLVRE